MTNDPAILQCPMTPPPKHHSCRPQFGSFISHTHILSLYALGAASLIITDALLNELIKSEVQNLHEIEFHSSATIMDEHLLNSGSKSGVLPGDLIHIPTFKRDEEEEEQVLDTRCLCHSGLVLLKKKDPFMFYSIPGMKNKHVADENLDISSLELDSKSSKESSLKPDSIPRYVKRRSRISYESCIIPSLDEISEIHGPSAKRRRLSSSGIEEKLYEKYGISRDMSTQHQQNPPSNPGDSLLDELFISMRNYS